jgi:hypothetical protein
VLHSPREPKKRENNPGLQPQRAEKQEKQGSTVCAPQGASGLKKGDKQTISFL